MLKVYLLTLFIFFQFALTAQQAYSQTSIQGRVLSADGSTIPKTAISIRQENPRDIFSGNYEDILPDENGSYQFLIREPGLYRITFRGVFHRSLSIPILIYDQSSMGMDILLLPIHYNNGMYFKNEVYLKWIRIYGNFNEYSFGDGKSFSLNNDGSISAFIPVTSDTIRYQVRGLTYGRGPTPLPIADEYHFNRDHGFESVLYKDLPEDSLEIRYTPGRDIPYKRYLPTDVNPQSIILNGIISLENRLDRYWVEPLNMIQSRYLLIHFVENELSSGIPAEMQIDIQQDYLGFLLNTDLGKAEKKIMNDLSNPELHPQQHVLLYLAYAGVLGWKKKKAFFRRHVEKEDTADISFDKEIVMSIPDKVPPVHPALGLQRGLADALLEISNVHPKFTAYFNELVKYHPNEQAVRSVALTLIRFLALQYETVEEIPVYQSIVERYGEGNLARDAHRAFDSRHHEHKNRLQTTNN